jgi:hypothetical protein
MRVAVPHSLGKDEALRRVKSRSHEIAGLVPGFAEVDTFWPSDNRMELNVAAMGQTLGGAVEIEETAVVFTVHLPAALSFVEPMIEKSIADKGRKLLG